MTDAETLVKVKPLLGVYDTYNDSQLLIKIASVKRYLLEAGVTQENIDNDLGITTIAVGVNDLWNLTSGEVKFSEAFTVFLVPQMQASSLVVTEEEAEDV